MIRKGERDKFEAHIIAQDDDCDYQESGWVAVRVGSWAAIARYSHCSCYGTWTSLTGGGISDSEGPDDPAWNWQGSPEELIKMAENCMDPSISDRKASPEDYDYDHLCNVYKQILDWSVEYYKESN